MRLTVRHDTLYRYENPMRALVQSHRLTPIVHEGQTVEGWDIALPEGASRGAELRDGAGNLIQTVSFRGPLEIAEIRVTGTVETRDTAGVLRGHRESVPPLAYLRATRATRADVALTELALSAVSEGQSSLERAHALSNAVADAIAYTPGRTGEATTAAEALAAGVGVCQDHAHALIAAARVADLPARYVTGYLWSQGGNEQVQVLGDAEPGDAPAQIQAQAQQQAGPTDPDQPEASHAWAELFVEDLGWVGFDASNRCCPDDRYVRLASGLDAAEAAPIRGVAQGMGAESMIVRVMVSLAD
jgi:transglutaminase-like putative cysteine protease